MRASLTRTIPFLVLLCALALPAGAVTVEQLYTAAAEVPDKGREAREAGFRAALEKVLVKVSGSDEILSNPDVESIVERPERYVQQYRYEALEREPGEASGEPSEPDAEAPGTAPTDGPAEGDAEDRPQHRLVVTFAGSRIRSEMEQKGLVVWGEQRPEILAWVAVDDGRERYLVSADGDSEAHRLLADVAAERGLPLLLPLLDTEDRRRIDFVDIKGGFFDTIRAASERYRAETLLVGYVERRRGRWLADWHLLGLGERQTWQGTRDELGGIVEAGIGGATERVAAALAGQGDERNRLRLRVRGLSGLDGYARVSGYLESLVRVRRAEIVTVLPDEIVFEVEVQGKIAELDRAIALGDTLRRAADEAPDGGQAAGDADGAATTTGLGETGGASAGAGDDPGMRPDAGGPAEATGGMRRQPLPERVYRPVS